MFFQKTHRHVSYFAFAELDRIPGFVHCFTSRFTDAAADRAADSRAGSPLFESLGVQVTGLRQVHSNHVARWDGIGPDTEGDGLLVDRIDAFGGVRTADCLPILIIDPKGRNCAVLHSGWRGTAARIAERGLEMLVSLCGAEPSRCLAAFGPCIRRCCYQVGDEVRQEFEIQGHPLDRIFQGRHLDIVESNRIQLEKMGLGSILDAGECTACRPDLFYSWRRSQDSGRMWAMAGFRAESPGRVRQKGH